MSKRRAEASSSSEVSYENEPSTSSSCVVPAVPVQASYDVVIPLDVTTETVPVYNSYQPHYYSYSDRFYHDDYYEYEWVLDAYYDDYHGENSEDEHENSEDEEEDGEDSECTEEGASTEQNLVVKEEPEATQTAVVKEELEATQIILVKEEPEATQTAVAEEELEATQIVVVKDEPEPTQVVAIREQIQPEEATASKPANDVTDCNEMEDFDFATLSEIERAPKKDSMTVKFPFEPSSMQRSMMKEIALAAMHKRTLLVDAPPGSGKTAALLCTLLAWLADEDSNAAEGAPLCNGNPAKKAKVSRKWRKDFRIIYAVRTASQLKQVINELMTIEYSDVPKTILTSRTNVSKMSTTDALNDDEEAMEKLLKEIRSNNQYSSGSSSTGVDAYVQSFLQLSEAKLVLCTQNYVLNEEIRFSIGLPLQDSVVVFDDAHNIIDGCLDNLRVSVQADLLQEYLTHLASLRRLDIVKNEATDGKPDPTELYGIQNFIPVLQRLQAVILSREDFSRLEAFLRVMERIGLTKDSITEHLNASTGAVRGFFRGRKNAFGNVTVFLRIVQKMISMEPSHIRHSAFKLSHPFHEIQVTCLDPSVLFTAICSDARSVILASGALSSSSAPQYLASELFFARETALAVHRSALSTLQRANGHAFLGLISRLDTTSPEMNLKANNQLLHRDQLLATLQQIFSVVPNGVIVCLPSKNSMETLLRAWSNKVENRESFGSGKRIFTQTYVYHALPSIESQQNGILYERLSEFKSEARKSTGAILFTYCRSSCSEGTNFCGPECRAVINIGLPFARLANVESKLAFNDGVKKNRNTLSHTHSSGSVWYETDAINVTRAALGRCVGFPNDWGLMFAIDERFADISEKMSSWALDISRPPYETTIWTAMKSSVISFIKQHSED